MAIRKKKSKTWDTKFGATEILSVVPLSCPTILAFALDYTYEISSVYKPLTELEIIMAKIKEEINNG